MKSLFLLPAALALGGSVYLSHPKPAPVQAVRRAPMPAGTAPLLTGAAAMGDWTTDAPGVRRRLTVPDLPAPFTTPSTDNGAHMVPRPEGALPKAPPGFTVTQFASGLDNPRKIVTAPNGDIFVAESGANRVKILRAGAGAAHPETTSVFAEGLRQPFGIAFYPLGANPKWVYVANTDSVVRFAYHPGDLKAAGEAQTVVPDISGGGRLRGGGHWTRDLAFSLDGTKMFVSVGSRSNHDDNDDEFHRANILQYSPEGVLDPKGNGFRIYASGIRNPVGIAVQPKLGYVWTSVNERDTLGDHLVPDYVTRVKEGGFYGWPWFYLGSHPDPKYAGSGAGAHPELAGHVTVPDVLLQSHSASLCLTFYGGTQFPAAYHGQIFACEHGSWNRAGRTGYKVILVPQKGGVASGEYMDFLTGFVTDAGEVWGRPVGVTTARDGSLLVTDDGSNSVWRVAYTGKK